MAQNNISALQKENGVILITAVLMLLVITLVGITSFRMNISDEQMARNTYLRAQAEEAAQITLRFAEDQILTAATTPQSFDQLVFYNNGGDDNDLLRDNDGDTCEGRNADGPGLCIPMRRTENYNPNDPDYENWVDKNDPSKDSLNVWSDVTKHRTLPVGAGSITEELGLTIPPQFIIEFLGYTPDINENSNLKFSYCDEDRSGDASGDSVAGWDVWPYCRFDHKSYRITALATAGTAQVMLQSVYTTP